MALGIWSSFGKNLDQNKNDGNVISSFKTKITYCGLTFFQFPTYLLTKFLKDGNLLMKKVPT